MQDFIPIAIAVALIWKVVDFLKMVLPPLPPQAVQVVAWVVGVLVALALRASDFGADVQVGARTLDQLNVWSVVFVGAAIASSSSALVDFKKARDNTDSAAVVPRGGPQGG